MRGFTATLALFIITCPLGHLAAEDKAQDKAQSKKVAEPKPELKITFAPGSELYVKRRAAGMDYHHAGIYVGQRQVVHVSAEPLGALKDLWDGKAMVSVIQTSYEEFAGQDEVTLGPSKPKFKMATIVRRSRSQVGQPWKYDAEKNNCQHFTSERVSGEAFSPEAKEMRAALTAVQDKIKSKAEAIGDKVKSTADDASAKAKSTANDATSTVKAWFSKEEEEKEEE